MLYCGTNNPLHHNCNIFQLFVVHYSVSLLLFLHSKLYRVLRIYNVIDLFAEYSIALVSLVILSKTYRGYVKPLITPNAIYNVTFV
jgi:hypothetical protein